MVNLALTLLAAAGAANAYWLMGMTDVITTVRIDPIVNPNALSGHAHTVVGGSGFRRTSSTAQLRDSKCTSTPIKEDKSNYWFPTMYFQWANGSFTSVDAGVVIYYLFDDKPGKTKAFPDDFRMLSGDPFLRTYDSKSYAQQAITFLCLDFNGVTTKHDRLPNKFCPSGIRAQINFPSCWDGKRTDTPNHKDHVAFRSGGPDSGSCTDPNYPIELPRIFLEAYMNTGPFDKVRGQAANPGQPFVYAHGDATGYGFHGDFFNGWMPGVLQKAVDGCNCNIYGDPQCCANKGIFTLDTKTHCKITSEVNEVVTGTLSKLPGYNPIQPEGRRAIAQVNPNPSTPPSFLSPVFEYTGNSPPGQGTPVAGNPPANTPAPSPTPVTPPVSNPSPTPVSPPSPPVVNPPAGSPTKSGSTSPAPTGGYVKPGHGHHGGSCTSSKKRSVRLSRNFESYDF